MDEIELYRRMYTHLFNRVTDALAQLRRLDVPAGINTLMDAQQETEELYAAGGENSDDLPPSPT